MAILVVVSLFVPLGALLGLKTESAHAASASTLNFQARLLSNTGAVVPDGTYNIEFKLYDVVSGGSALWTDTRYDQNGVTAGLDYRVTVKYGYFSVALGDTTAGGTAFPGTINWDQEHWLSMNIGGDTQTATPTWDGEMTPRFKLTAVPYAFRAGSAAAVTTNNTNTGSTNSAAVSITTGNATGATSNSGNITIDTGTATQTTGAITLGATNASALTLGRSGLTTTNVGNLVIQGGTATLGTTTQAGSLVVSDGSSNTGTILLNATAGDYTFTIPTVTANDTFCLLTLNNCTGVATTLQNAYTNDVDGSDAVILLTAADGAVVIRDAASTVTNLFTIEANGGADYLAVTNTTITAGLDVVVAANKSLTVTGGNTASRPASPTEGMVYYDTTTKQLLTYANGKWQQDRTDAVIVAASNSSQSDKDAADFVADGNTAAANDGDQIEINNALTAGSGKKVVLLAGTYVVDATILIPDNTTFVGVGKGTLIELADLDATENIIENSNTTTGTSIVIRDMRVSGRSDLNTAGTQHGVYIVGMGDGTQSATGRRGFEISGVYFEAIRNYELYAGTGGNSFVRNNYFAVGSNASAILFDNTDNTTINGNTIVAASSADVITLTNSQLDTVSNNTITGNINKGINLLSTSYIQISSNTIKGFTTDIELASGNNTVTNNNVRNINVNSSFNVVDGNFIETGSIQSNTASNNNIISNNFVYNAGGTTSNDAINIGGDKFTVVGNRISDTSCTTTCRAIRILSFADQTYVADNTFETSSGTATIDDQGTNTIFGGQAVSQNGVDILFKQANSTTAFKVQNSSGANILNVDTTNSEVEVGNTATAGRLVISDGSSNTGTILVNATAGDYTFTIPTVTANDTFCLLSLANCAGTTLQAAYSGDADGSDTRIDLTTADDSLIFSNPASGGTDSTFVLKVEQLNTGALDTLVLSNSGTGNIATLQTAGTTRAAFDANANLIAANSATGTTGTATAVAGTNTTTILLTAAGSFADNDIIFINNAGQDYYTRITAGGGTTTLTVSPAVSYDASVTIAKYITQNIGATTTDYTTLSNRFFQGYFLGGIVTGAGSTTYADALISSSPGLTISTSSASAAALIVNNNSSTGNIATFQDNGTVVASIEDTGKTIFRNATNMINAFQVQNAVGSVSMLNVDTLNSRVGIGTATPSSTLEVVQGSSSTTALTVSYSAVPGSPSTAYGAVNFNALTPSPPNWTTSYDTTEVGIYSSAIDYAADVMYQGSDSGGIIYRCVLSTNCDASGDYTTSYDTTETTIASITVDTENAVMYVGTTGSGIIYRCVLSTNCDASGDYTTSYDTAETTISSITPDYVNDVLYAIGGSGDIYRCAFSTNCDSSGDWTFYDPGTANSGQSLTIDTVNNVLYAGVNVGTQGRVFRCVLSTACDASGDWTSVMNHGFGTSSYTVKYSASNGMLYAGSNTATYYDVCDTVTNCDASGDFTTLDITSLGVTTHYSIGLNTVNGVLYNGMNNGIILQCYLSTKCDALTEWSVNVDTTELTIRSLLHDSERNVMYAGSASGGIIYRYDTSGGTGASISYAKVNAFAVSTTNAAETGALGFTTLSGGAAVQGLYLQGGNVTATGNTNTTGTTLQVQGNALTTGTALNVSAATNTLTSGNIAVISQSGAYTGVESITGNSLSVSRSLSTNNASSPTVTRQATTNNSSPSGGSSRTYSHTVTAQTNQILLVSVETTGTNVPTSVTFNGSNLTMGASAVGTATVTSFWYLANPAVTTANVVITMPSVVFIYSHASNVYNVDLANPISNSASDVTSNANASVNVTSSSAGDLLFDAYAHASNNAITPGAGQTALFDEVPTASLRTRGSTKPGAAGTVAMSVTAPALAHAYLAVNIKAASALGIAVTSAAVNISSNCTVLAGSCYDSSNVLNVTQSYAASSGSVLKVTSSGVGNALEVVDGSTTSFAVADGGATTATATAASTVAFTANNSTSTGNIANFQDNGTNVFTIADGGTVTATGAGVTTGTSLVAVGDSLTTGGVFSASSSSANYLSGSVASFSQTGTYTAAQIVSTNTSNVSRSLTTASTTVTVQRQSTTNNSAAGAAASRTYSHTVTAQNSQLLLVSVETSGTSVPNSVTFNGTNLTMAASAVGTTTTVSAWYLTNPAVTTANVVVTMPSSVIIYSHASNLYNVDLANPISNSATDVTANANPSVNVTSTSTGDLLFDVYAHATNLGIAPGAGQTGLFDEVPTASLRSRGSTKPGASGTVAMTETVVAVAHAYLAFNVKVNPSPGILVTGAAATISSNCTASSGTCTDTSNVLAVTQNFTGATGSVLKVVNAGTGNIAEFVDGATTAFSIADGGSVLSKTTVNSTTAFQIQNAAGTTFLNVDTTNQELTLRNKTDLATLGADIFAASCTGTNWTGTNPYTHTTGSVAALTCTTPTVVANRTYEITYTTAGTTLGESFMARIGGVDGNAIYGNATSETQIITSTTTGSLTFTPTSSAAGSITINSVKQVTTSLTPFAINDSTNAPKLEVRAFGSSQGIGLSALQANTTGDFNTATGYDALYQNTTGTNNTATGAASLFANTSGSYNATNGFWAMRANVSGSYNTAIGSSALRNSTNGSSNTAVGYYSLNGSTTGDFNTGLGTSSLRNNTRGSYNLGLGYYAGYQGTSTQFLTKDNLQKAAAIGTYAQVYQNSTIALGAQGADNVKVGIGTGLPTGTLTVEPFQYNTGTVDTTASSGTVTGTGTTFTTAMIGSKIYIATNSATTAPYSGTITAVASGTSITVSPTVSANYAAAQYYINYIGLSVKTDGDTLVGGNLLSTNSATGVTGTTEAVARTNVTTVTLTAAGSFANNDIIFINNAGQDYYTRITAGGGTTTLTVSPAVSYDVSAAVTKYNAQNIGATSTDYTTQTNRFFQGYFLGGVVTGAGSTTLSDQNLTSSGSMNIQAVAGTLNLTSSGAATLTASSLNVVSNASGEQSSPLRVNGAPVFGWSTSVVPNGDMEQWDTGNTKAIGFTHFWQSGAPTIARSTTHYGNVGAYSAQVNFTAASNGYQRFEQYEPMDVSPGEYIEISAFAQYTGTAGATVPSIEIGLLSNDHLNDPEFFATGVAFAGTSCNITVASTWQQCRTRIQVPAGDYRARVVVTILQGNAAGAIVGYVDKIQATRQDIANADGVLSTSAGLTVGGYLTMADVSGYGRISTTSDSGFVLFSDSDNNGADTGNALMVCANASNLGCGTMPLQLLQNGDMAITGALTMSLNNTVTVNGICHSGADVDVATATQRQLVACSAAPNDYAEFYPAEQGVEAGDIVATTPNTLTYEASGADAETGIVRSLGTKKISIIKKAIIGDSAIGIISTAPYQTIGKDIPVTANRKPLALSGRVPVKVNNEGGDIAVGDRITMSTVAGIGRKATTSGYTVGTALEGFSGTNGVIYVLVDNSYYTAPLTDILQGAGLEITSDALFGGAVSVGGSLNVSGPTTLTNLTVSGSITVQQNLIVLGNTEVSNLTVERIISKGNVPTAVLGATTGQNGTIIIEGNDTTGTIQYTAGTPSLPANPLAAGEQVTVTFDKLYAVAPRVTLTPNSQDAANVRYYVLQTATDFKVVFTDVPTAGSQYNFNYQVIQ